MAQLSFQGQGKLFIGDISVTVSALAAAAEEVISLSISDAAVGDIVVMTPPEAAIEAGLSVLRAHCSAAGTVKLKVGNDSGSGLTGSTESWKYCLLRAS